MRFNPADPISLLLFSIMSAVMFGLILFSFKKYQVASSFRILFITYIIIFSAFVYSGLVIHNVVPAAPILFTSVLVMAVAFAFKDPGKKVSLNVSVFALVALQSFRLPLELILHHWSTIGTIPNTMTWTGQNLDILTGILALLFLPLIKKFPILVWIFEVVGSLLLINVIRVVILSSPFPFSWNLENPLQLIFYFPYALIAPLFVGTALFAHIVLARKLLTQGKSVNFVNMTR